MPLEEVLASFGDTENLQTLAPAWLDFALLTPKPVPKRPETHIDYRLRLHGIPLRWRSEITSWEPPRHFGDEQRSGP